MTARAKAAVVALVRSARECRTRNARIEDRHEASLELGSVRHRQACAREDRGEATGAHHSGDLDQLIGVVGAACACCEDEIVAGALAFRANVPSGHPRQRVEPVQPAGRLRQHVREAIAPLDVRQLVQQHDPKPFSRPLVGRRRHQHGGTEHAPRHRHGGPLASKEHDPWRNAKLRGQRLRLLQPGSVGHALGSPRHPLHRNHAGREPRKDEQRANGPHAHQQRGPRYRCSRW